MEPVYNLTRGTDRHQSWTPTLQCNTNLCPSTLPSWISFYWSHSVIMEKILWIKRLLDRGIHLFSSAQPPVGYQTARVQGEDRWVGNLWVPVWTERAVAGCSDSTQNLPSHTLRHFNAKQHNIFTWQFSQISLKTNSCELFTNYGSWDIKIWSLHTYSMYKFFLTIIAQVTISWINQN